MEKTAKLDKFLLSDIWLIIARVDAMDAGSFNQS